MGKQAKAKTNKGARNDARPNGKAWKKSHKGNPPVEQAVEQSKIAHRKNATRK
jgi:hypothetical protein